MSMATQSSSSTATDHSVIQSSIALGLLQERFLQLQKDKEMRQRKELLKTATTSSSHMDLPASNPTIKYNIPPAAAAATTTIATDLSHSVTLQHDSEHHHHSPNHTTPNDLKMSLSLWPVSTHANSHGGKKGEHLETHHHKSANYTPPLNDVTLLSNSCMKFRSVHYQSVPSDVVDTSLHL